MNSSHILNHKSHAKYQPGDLVSYSGTLKVTLADNLISEYQPDVDMDFVFRLLGKKTDMPVSRATQRRVDTALAKAMQFMKPRITASLHQLNATSDKNVTLANGIAFASTKFARYMKGADLCVILAGTIGADIDVEINRLMQRNRITDAYILDAIGSGAVESLVSRFQQDMEDRLEDLSSVSGLRFSPGYCDWPIGDQHKLFDLLNADAVGISLAPSGLMQPRKSISASFGIFPESFASKIPDKTPCLHCAKKNCIARRKPPQEAPPS